MSLSKNEEVDSNGGPFTRKKLLETTTKAAGVLGAGLFVETGFIAGVPYNGKPDLSGKVCPYVTMHFVLMIMAHVPSLSMPKRWAENNNTTWE